VRLAEGPTAVGDTVSLLQDQQLFWSLQRERHPRASRGVVARTKLCVLTRPRLFGSPRVPWGVCFRTRLRDWLVNRPRSVVFRFSLPSCRLSFRVPSSQLPLCAFARRATCLGFCPPSDITSSLPSAEPPRLSWRHPRCSQPLDGFCDEACELVSSRSQIQDSSLVQGFVSLVQPSAFIRLDAPMPLSVRALTCEQAATYEHLDSDVLFHTKSLATGSVVSLPNGRAPLRVLLLLQVTQASAMTVARPRSLMPLPSRLPLALRGGRPSDSSARLQRISNAGLELLLPGPRTCPSFSDLPTCFSKSLPWRLL
jgi:hypothetical protein